MSESEAQPNPAQDPARGTRTLGLSVVERFVRFLNTPGPAVLLTTEERLRRFEDAAAFGTTITVDPDVGNWHGRSEKTVLTVQHAVRAFPADPDAYQLEFTTGATFGRDDLIDRLDRFGYPRDALPGVTVRGDTVTVHLTEQPEGQQLRLSFFGDEIDALHLSDNPIERFTLEPQRDADTFDAEGTWEDRVLDHLPGTVFLDVPELYAGTVGDDETVDLLAGLAGREVHSFGRDALTTLEDQPHGASLPYYRAQLDRFATDVDAWCQAGYAVSVLLRFDRTGRYLQEKVLTAQTVRFANTLDGAAGEVTMAVGVPSEGGFVDEQAKRVFVTEDLLYGHQGARKLGRLPGKAVQDATQLSVGDYLIHPDQGVGRFAGLVSREVIGVARDYLEMHYAGEGRMFLPVESLPLLRRHPGTSDAPPKLSTLGTNEWNRAKEKARVNAQELAAELIKTYAKRQVTSGTAFPPQAEFDAMADVNFPFELTPDQATAVKDVLADMERDVPMDRLISGDVGFGKTEVAVRAALRAVGNGRQVAMMVPTTVLAQQHYETFSERFAGLPVEVGLLSRYTSDKEARRIVEGLADGQVDVVIGTHRLLADAIKYKQLGLLIIDEEHRFGVGQKETLKSLRANLDVLSLSATPIPRTLYMSLVGLRDVSQIMTPPKGRKPIQTVLQPYDPMTVRTAILHELERGGKTFYIHDRIGSIGMRARTLQALVPEIRIGVAHGQMGSDELEQVMLGFQDGAFDVLLSTTIVESGLDVAGANTLLVERADRLGLAQLYQLRGRVGRRETEAWAYLLYPGRLTERAQRRLNAIAELNDLGSGHLLAEKDMEIRGVGNLLGPEQHGNVSAVSLEVYTELLAEEVAKLKGESPKEARPQVGIDLEVDARLPASYLANDDDRIATYGMFAEASGLADVARIAKDLRSRLGPFPPEVKAFVDLVKLRLLAESKGVASIKEHRSDVQISFKAQFDELDYDPQKLRQFDVPVEATRYPPGFSITKRGIKSADLPSLLQRILYTVG